MFSKHQLQCEDWSGAVMTPLGNEQMAQGLAWEEKFPQEALRREELVSW